MYILSIVSDVGLFMKMILIDICWLIKRYLVWVACVVVSLFELDLFPVGAVLGLVSD